MITVFFKYFCCCRFTKTSHAAVNVTGCSIARRCTPLIRTLALVCATVVHSPAHQCMQLTWTYVDVYATVHTNAQLDKGLIPHHVNAYATQVAAHLVRRLLTLRVNVCVTVHPHVHNICTAYFTYICV